MINLDTHILVFALQGDLQPKERDLLSLNRWGISAIVLWELAKLKQLGRIRLDLESPRFLAAISGIQIWPIDMPVARRSTQLDFQADPADELIAATSIVHNAPLLTRDRRILASKNVPLAG